MGSGYLKATLNLQKCCNQCCSISWVVNTCNLQVTCKNLLIKARAVASLGGGGAGFRAAVPTGPVEPDKSILWMDLFSFYCSDLQLFAIFMAEKLVGPRCVQVACKYSSNQSCSIMGSGSLKSTVEMQKCSNQSQSRR